jgi:hypothetical protein
MSYARKLKRLYCREFIEKMPVTYHLVKELDASSRAMLKVAPSPPYNTKELLCKPFEKYSTRFSDLILNWI